MRPRSPLARHLAAASAVASLIAARPAVAAWNPAGEPISAPNCQSGVAACPDISRGLYTFWSDGGSASRVLKAHRRHADGATALEWPPAGAAVGSIEAFLPATLAAAPDGSGGAYVIAWAAFFSATQRIQVWRFDASGGRAPGWPDSGLFVGTVGKPKDAFVVSDGAGGAFVGWVELLDWLFAGTHFRTLNAVRMVRVLADGSVAPGWSASGNSVFEPDPKQHFARRTMPTLCVADGTGGAWIAHADSSDGVLDARLYRMAATGSLAPGFAPAGVLVGSAGAEQLLTAIASDGAGGVFTYGTSGSYPSTSVRLGRFAPGGSPVAGWTSDGIDPLPGAPGPRLTGAMISDGAGGAVLADASFTTGASYRLLRVGPTGSPLAGWPTLGVAIPDTLNYATEKLVADGEGGATLVALKSPNPALLTAQHFHVVAARVRGDGVIPSGWPAGTLAVTDSNTASLVTVVGDGRGAAYAVRRTTTEPPTFEPCQVLAHRIGPDGGSTSGVQGSDVSPARLSASPNPSWQSVGLTLTLSEASHASVEVIDASGRHVRTLDRRTLEPGQYRYVWNGRDDAGRLAAPGVYMVRARGPRQPLATKVVRVL